MATDSRPNVRGNLFQELLNIGTEYERIESVANTIAMNFCSLCDCDVPSSPHMINHTETCERPWILPLKVSSMMENRFPPRRPVRAP